LAEQPALKRSLSSIDRGTVHHSVYKSAKNKTELKSHATLYDGWHKTKHIAKNWSTKTGGEFGWTHISYDFLIALDGSWIQTQDLKYILMHSGDWGSTDTMQNKKGIAICVDGNFDKEKPNDLQLGAIVEILLYVKDKYGVKINPDLIVGHRDISATSCPGRYLYAKLGQIKLEYKKAMLGYFQKGDRIKVGKATKLFSGKGVDLGRVSAVAVGTVMSDKSGQLPSGLGNNYWYNIRFNDRSGYIFHSSIRMKTISYQTKMNGTIEDPCAGLNNKITDLEAKVDKKDGIINTKSTEILKLEGELEKFDGIKGQLEDALEENEQIKDDLEKLVDARIKKYVEDLTANDVFGLLINKIFKK